jgi:hypothetical protein
MRMVSCAFASAVLLALPGMASADPDKDESGQRDGGRAAYNQQYDDGQLRRTRNRESVRIPRGHMPPPGECRTWYERPACGPSAAAVQVLTAARADRNI